MQIKKPRTDTDIAREKMGEQPARQIADDKTLSIIRDQISLSNQAFIKFYSHWALLAMATISLLMPFCQSLASTLRPGLLVTAQCCLALSLLLSSLSLWCTAKIQWYFVEKIAVTAAGCPVES